MKAIKFDVNSPNHSSRLIVILLPFIDPHPPVIKSFLKF
jgi:hypothetical protein